MRSGHGNACRRNPLPPKLITILRGAMFVARREGTCVDDYLLLPTLHKYIVLFYFEIELAVPMERWSHYISHKFSLLRFMPSCIMTQRDLCRRYWWCLMCSEVSRLLPMFFYASISGPRQVRSHKRMARISVRTRPSIDRARLTSLWSTTSSGSHG